MDQAQQAAPNRGYGASEPSTSAIPSGARDQSDAVALAVDNPGWRSDTAKHGNPFENTAWVKSCIASGALVPPVGESAAVRRTDFAVGLCVICLGACGVVAMLIAYFWKG